MASRANKVSTPADAKDRYRWMDLSRGLAIVLVVIVHAGAMYREQGFALPGWIQSLDWAMSPYRMPLLVFLSGFLLDTSLRKGVVPFIYGKVRNILWPYLLWTAIFCLAIFDPGRMLDPSVWRGGTYLWYMLFIGVFFAIGLITARVPHLVIAAVAVGIAFLMPDGSKYGERLFVLMAYFFMGAATGQHADRFVAALRHPWALAFVPFAAALSLTSALGSRVHYAPQYAIVIIPAVFGVLALMARLERGRIADMFSFIGRKSVVYYVMHVPIYAVILHFTVGAGLTSAYLNIALCLLAGFLIPTIFAHWMDRSRAVKLLYAAPDVIDFAPESRATKLSAAVERLRLLPDRAAT